MEMVMQSLGKAIFLAFLVVVGFAMIWAGIAAYQVIFQGAELNLANMDLMLYMAGGIFLVFVVFFLFQGRK